MTFEELTASPELRRAVEDLGWTEPTRIQQKAIPAVRAGRDVVGIAQTGTGKTGAFLIPVLENLESGGGPRALVVCPTRELARQVAADAAALAAHMDLSIAEIYGGAPYEPQLKALREGVDVLVATPGRLIDHVERGTADLGSVEVLILDEADRMLDMGFRPQIERILKPVPTKRQTLLFSATMPNGVHALAIRILKDPEWVEATPESMAAETVTQTVYSVHPARKPDLLMKLLSEQEMDQVLVFTRTKAGADVLHSRLKAEKIEAGVLHGDRRMKQRRQALEAFAEGRVRVLVATDVAQRGLDIEGISHVINYDVPHDPEDYVHRIGRTGRAGAAGKAITFMTAGELGQVRSIERLLGYDLERVSLEDYDYAGGPNTAPKRVRSNRSGRRMGARRTDELSAEELSELLKVG